MFAAERTLLAWQRTAIALMIFDFVVERFDLSVQSLCASQHFSQWLGVGLMLIGVGVAVVSALTFRHVTRGLGEQEIPRGYWNSLGVWLNFLLAMVAVALAANFIWVA